MKTTVTIEFGPDDSAEAWFSDRENDREVHRGVAHFAQFLREKIKDAKEWKHPMEGIIWQEALDELISCIDLEGGLITEN